MHYMEHNIKSLAACVCVSVCARARVFGLNISKTVRDRSSVGPTVMKTWKPLHYDIHSSLASDRIGLGEIYWLGQCRPPVHLFTGHFIT